MSDIKPGDHVVLIFPLPFEAHLVPIGSKGVVAYDDFDGDVGVFFEGNPCPAGPMTDWITPKSCLAKLNPPSEGDSLPTRKELDKPLEIEE